jgi:hypothetical protein
MNYDNLLTAEERTAGRQKALDILKRCAVVLRPPPRGATSGGPNADTTTTPGTHCE